MNREVIVIPADQVTLHQFVNIADAVFELDEILPAVVRQGDFGEDRDCFGEL